MFPSWLSGGLFPRALDRQLVTINLHNIRDYTHDKHHTVDDAPYGGGAGMVLKPEPIFETVAAIKSAIAPETGTVPVILLTPQGRLLTQAIAQELAQYRHLILICGHYEGVDERVGEYLATDQISIGDYVLSGGELAAMVLAEAVIRLVPGVLGSADSLLDDSHATGLLEYPQYTRPPVYQGWAVPEVLLSGNHAQVAQWRREQALRRTRERRPELLAKVKLTTAEKELVNHGQQS